MVKGAVNIPLVLYESGSQGRVWYACHSGELGNSVLIPFVLKPSVVGSIVGLFSACSPATVLRSVVFTAVYAINRVLTGWSFAHVINEVDNAIKPPVANNNSSATVFSKPVVLDVVATMLHQSVNVVLRGAREAVRFVMICHANILRDIAQMKSLWRPDLSTGVQSLNLSTSTY